MKRTVIIGDVHGCMQELQTLLQELSVSPQDQLISVGDLISKGPDSAAVLDWAMQTKNLRCVQGNHELRLLHLWSGSEPPNQKPYDADTLRQLSHRVDDYMEFIRSWPLFIAEKDFLVVHAGFDPAVASLAEQDPWQLTNIRRLGTKENPWYEQYTGCKLVVFGHWARRQPLVRDNCIGLDTGCVYGGALSALVLPERKIVSVPARKAYWKKESWN